MIPSFLPSHPPLHNRGAVKGAPPLSAESLMLNVQLLVAKDFDEQMRRVGDQLKFLSGIKKSYRDRIFGLQNFLTQNPGNSRKDGKKYVEATFGQMAELCGNLVVSAYDIETMRVTEQGLSLETGGDRHGLDGPDRDGITWVPLKDGKMNARDLTAYFAHGASLADPSEASEFAGLAGDDGNGLFFYRGHQNGTNGNGDPKFTVFVDQLERLTAQLKDKLSGTEEESEQLGARLTELSAQRKAALDGANQLISKMEQIRSRTLEKTG